MTASAFRERRLDVKRHEAQQLVVVISVSSTSPPPSRICRERACLDSISASIRSSTVPRQTNLCTSTLLFWPMRKARSVAWFSTAGFHQRSKWMTCEAAVRLRPVPPALSESTKNGGPSSRWNCVDQLLALLDRASRRAAPGPGGRRRRRGTRPAARSISRNWVKTSTFSCRAAISSAELAPGARTCRCRVGGVVAVAEPLRGVVADLLEPHQRRQDQPAPLRSRRRLPAASAQLVDGLLVERRLLLASGRRRPCTSVLSGRSAITRLSVFSRRRM